jgi:transcriptional regulator NrdR family protein
MNEEKTSHALAPQTADYVASAAKAALGVVPFAGSLLAEIAGTVIPNQRIERIVQFAQELESRLSGIEQQFVRSQLANENFTDLMEEGLRQAARSVSQERRAHIAALISNSLSSQEISYVESKHLLRILGELNDIEIIRLGSHLYETFSSGDEYWEKHKGILEPVAAHMGSPQEELDKETLQESYDAHLTQLGLLKPRYAIDSGTKQPEFDSHTGAQKIRGHELTALGRLLLRQVEISVDEAG